MDNCSETPLEDMIAIRRSVLTHALGRKIISGQSRNTNVC